MKGLRCSHDSLHLDVSSHAVQARYLRYSDAQRLAAGQQPKATKKQSTMSLPPTTQGLQPRVCFLNTTCGALPLDPKYPPQSLRLWTRRKDRNIVADRGRTVHVVPHSIVADEVRYISIRTFPEINRQCVRLHLMLF
ncbi:hypothetical protein BAUCODRAFT_215946 [Baudoinia panamericana UAMH 10762]|uniref:Uncharacterized protein n=1 Tax=Baudoinia panamericana (strain UAMH 10762) TaxID=717646 RepID=M2MBT1_BAUPA|nr:uncharacterized protein BAUCODRAFT_215946 [Baudoinia panamericana UAMH 10762]EMC93951.1 hypothetical protein BAUCODRAFT_215946 [Baudoinia panamericana UAMH 10762]